MIKFKLDDKEYIIEDFISIESYSKIYKVKDLFTDTYFSAKLINIITGAPVEDLLQADYNEISYLASYIMELLPQDKPKFVDRIEIDGVHYGFFTDWRNISFAEFVDMDTISTKKPDELMDLLHILASIMYRPIVEEKSKHDFKIEKYEVQSMKQRAELFKNKLDVKVILGAQFFFIKFANRYSNYFHLSSMPKLSIWTKMKLMWNLRKIIWKILFKRSTDGTLSSTEFLKTILRNINISTIKK